MLLVNENKENNGIDNLKTQLINSSSYKEGVAKFERRDNFKIKVICGGVFFLIVGSALFYYQYIPIPLDWYPITAVAAIFLVCSFITYASLTGNNFNQFATDFFNENQKVIEDSFKDGLKNVDELYNDSSLDKPIRVKGCDADILSFSKEIIRDTGSYCMAVYCIFKIEGVAIRVKKVVRLSNRGDGKYFGELIISDYQVSRLSNDDLANEYKNKPDIYQKHFS